MTYIMPFGDPYSLDVYDLARRMSPCSCESWVPIAVEIPDSMCAKLNRFHVETPRELGTYCVRCRRRSSIIAYARSLVYISGATVDQLFQMIPCEHFSAWEITPWLLNRSDIGRFGMDEYYTHLLYCRTCRKVYKVILPADISVRKGEE